MNTNPSRSLGPTLLLAVLLAGCSSAPDRPDRDTILLLHTNDIHSHLLPDAHGNGGMARIGGYVDRERAGRPDVLLLDAGDGVMGTPVSTLFEGRPIFHVMSEVGYDAMALGNHEFDRGFERIADYRRIAAFPILSANVRGPDGELLGDGAYRIYDVDGVRVGVIGVVTASTPAITAEGVTEGCVFLPAEEALPFLVAQVGARADLVVVLSHLGFEEDRALAAAVPGIDLIVGGHSHTELPEPVRVGETRIVQAGTAGRWIGRLEIEVDLVNGRIEAIDGSLVAVDEALPESRRVRAAVDVWEDQADRRVSEVIGTAPEELSGNALKAAIEAVYRTALGTDLGYQNPGGIRAALPAGDITIRNVWNILPFDNTLVTVRVRGADLPGWARKMLADIEPDRVYTIATNSFVAYHTEQYFPAGVQGREDSGRAMRDAVIDHVRENGNLMEP